jgi:hypothetical protein
MPEKNTEGAFIWIVGLLHKHAIPFQIAGGFAARLYGSERELADIDIGIPDDRFDDLYPEVKEYITFGPEQYLDDEWDLKLMTLKYEGQEIDIAGQTNIKIFDKDGSGWISASRDLSVSEIKEVYGLNVPVIPKDALIAYKKMLKREVDLLDLNAIESRG